MAYRWRPKNAQVDPDNPKAWGQCDRCSMLYNLDVLQWQYGYQGSTMPQNTRMLVCPKHLDPLNPQDAAYILPPDPVPVLNAREGAYTIDETSWLSTQDDDVIAAQNGDLLITPIPNPDGVAATSEIVFSLASTGASVATLYLDLFDGNPVTTGVSVLADITGSATRTDIASQLTTASLITQNTSPVTVTSSATAGANVSWVGFYSAASGGTLLLSAPVSVSPTISAGNVVAFPALGIRIDTN